MSMECSIKHSHLGHPGQHLFDDSYTFQVSRVMGRSKNRVLLDRCFHLLSHKCGLAICGTAVNDAMTNHCDLRGLINNFRRSTPDGLQHVLDDAFPGACRQAFMPGLTTSCGNLNFRGFLMPSPIRVGFPQWRGWLFWQRIVYFVQATLLAA